MQRNSSVAGWWLRLQRQGGNGDSNSLLNPGIWRRQKVLSFLAPPLHLPSLYHGAASLRIDSFYGSIWGEHTMYQAQFKVLGIYLWTKPRLLSLTNILLEEQEGKQQHLRNNKGWLNEKHRTGWRDGETGKAAKCWICQLIGTLT